MNPSESGFKITPFWYRRICEVSLFVALTLIGFFIFGLTTGQTLDAATKVMPLAVVIAASAVAASSTMAYFFAPRERLASIALTVYLGLLITIGILVTTTNPVASPFIGLWMVGAIFAGLFGGRTVAFLLSTTLVYAILDLFVVKSMNNMPGDLLLYSIAYQVPLVVSYGAWRNKTQADGQKDRAYNDLVRELSQVANKSEIVINAIADGVIAIDGQNVIQLINPAAQELTGWVKQDALKLDYKSILKLTDNTGKPLDTNTDPLQKVLHANQSVIDNSLTLETKSGKKLLVSIHASPAGQIGAGAIVVFRDITKEKQEERQQAEFISTASHEMRTPVATVEGYLGLALNPGTATIDEKARTYLLRAQDSVHHLAVVFNSALVVIKTEPAIVAHF